VLGGAGSTTPPKRNSRMKKNVASSIDRFESPSGGGSGGEIKGANEPGEEHGRCQTNCGGAENSKLGGAVSSGGELQKDQAVIVPYSGKHQPSASEKWGERT